MEYSNINCRFEHLSKVGDKLLPVQHHSITLSVYIVDRVPRDCLDEPLTDCAKANLRFVDRFFKNAI